jgi:hypothetical protein
LCAHHRLPVQMLDLDESKVERVGVDDIVFDALAPRVRDMPLEGRRPRGSARLLEQKVAVEERHDDIIGLMDVPPRLRAGLKPPLGDPHMRLGDVDVGRGFGAWRHGPVRVVICPSHSKSARSSCLANADRLSSRRFLLTTHHKTEG